MVLIRTDPDRSGPTRTDPDQSGPIRTHPDPSGPIRTHPDPSGPIQYWSEHIHIQLDHVFYHGYVQTDPK